jgi:hypothetical protein
VAERPERPPANSEALVGGGGEAGRGHGVSPTAKAVHLEYGKLKRLTESAGEVTGPRAAKAPRVRSRWARGPGHPRVLLIGARDPLPASNPKIALPDGDTYYLGFILKTTRAIRQSSSQSFTRQLSVISFTTVSRVLAALTQDCRKHTKIRWGPVNLHKFVIDDQQRDLGMGGGGVAPSTPRRRDGGVGVFQS